MAIESPWGKIGFLKANSSLTTKQFYAVKVTSAGGVSLCGAGDGCTGILQNNPDSDEAADIMSVGVSKAIYGASVTAGDALMSDASGKLIPHTSTNEVIAIALEGGSTGELHTVLLAKESASGLSANYSVMSIPLKLAKIANGDIVTDFIPGFAGQLLGFHLIVTDPATTAAKTSALHLEIGATPTTGGVLTLTSANCTPLGHVVDATAITALNVFTNTDAISVVAASTTAFVEGEGVMMIVLKSA